MKKLIFCALKLRGTLSLSPHSFRYCSPRYDFPPQEDVVSFVVGVALERLSKDPKTLIVCGAYTIGKERIYTSKSETATLCVC